MCTTLRRMRREYSLVGPVTPPHIYRPLHSLFRLSTFLARNNWFPLPVYTRDRFRMRSLYLDQPIGNAAAALETCGRGRLGRCRRCASLHPNLTQRRAYVIA